jgi:oxygen-independent coproporphyrinogen-3 oxidase
MRIVRIHPPNSVIGGSGEEAVNFYQFPPLLPVPAESRSRLAERLGLEEPGTAEPFAVFVSVPYCVTRCHSCTFFKEPVSREDVDRVVPDYISCVLRELSGYRGAVRFQGGRCGAVYFGGGTGSLLPATSVAELIDNLRDHFCFAPDVEITLEGNPSDFGDEYLAKVIEAGVNRISIGLQSFDAKTLQSIGSPHSAMQSVQSVESAARSTLRTYNVDLLLGIPGQSEQEYFTDLHQALEGRAPSIKVYEYRVYPGTRMVQLLETGAVAPQVSKDERHRWYRKTQMILEDAGYIEGRKGSFAIPGHRQRYGRIAYDQAGELVGIGAGSYSFVNGIQFANASKVRLYREMVAAEIFPPAAFASRKSGSLDLMKRFTIFSLFSGRISRRGFECIFKVDPLTIFSPIISEFIRAGLIETHEEDIVLTEQGTQERRKVMGGFYSFETATT